jgi:transposase InsO family protein
MRVDPKQIILALKENDDRIRQTARQLGISPSTVLNWKRRAGTGSLARRLRYSTRGLTRRSTRPRSVRETSLTAAEQDALTGLRRKTGYGADKLKVLAGLPQHPRTVHRFLKAKGLTVPGHNYRRPKYQETTHMHAKNATQPGKLQMDVKYVTPQLSGLPHTCYLYAVMDIWSRYKEGVILPLLDQGLAIEAMRTVVTQLPFKSDFIQTDNGLEFQARFHAVVTEELGLEHHYIHKSSPNENAVIERSFRTDEEEFFWRIDQTPRDIMELSLWYEAYLHTYNTYRPHLGIDLLTPLEKLASVQ